MDSKTVNLAKYRKDGGKPWHIVVYMRKTGCNSAKPRNIGFY